MCDFATFLGQRIKFVKGKEISRNPVVRLNCNERGDEILTRIFISINEEEEELWYTTIWSAPRKGINRLCLSWGKLKLWVHNKAAWSHLSVPNPCGLVVNC